MIQIVTETDYKKAFKEVLTILEFIPKEDYEKIPDEIINTLKSFQDIDFNYELDFSKDFQNQDISETAQAILANFYRDYWADEKERNQILIEEELERNHEEELKRIQYNPENVFKKNNIKEEIKCENIETSSSLTVIKKGSFFSKIIKKILSIF